MEYWFNHKSGMRLFGMDMPILVEYLEERSGETWVRCLDKRSTYPGILEFWTLPGELTPVHGACPMEHGHE